MYINPVINSSKSTSVNFEGKEKTKNTKKAPINKKTQQKAKKLLYAIGGLGTIGLAGLGVLPKNEAKSNNIGKPKAVNKTNPDELKKTGEKVEPKAPMEPVKPDETNVTVGINIEPKTGEINDINKTIQDGTLKEPVITDEGAEPQTYEKADSDAIKPVIIASQTDLAEQKTADTDSIQIQGDTASYSKNSGDEAIIPDAVDEADKQPESQCTDFILVDMIQSDTPKDSSGADEKIEPKGLNEVNNKFNVEPQTGDEPKTDDEPDETFIDIPQDSVNNADTDVMQQAQDGLNAGGDSQVDLVENKTDVIADFQKQDEIASWLQGGTVEADLMEPESQCTDFILVGAPQDEVFENVGFQMQDETDETSRVDEADKTNIAPEAGEKSNSETLAGVVSDTIAENQAASEQKDTEQTEDELIAQLLNEAGLGHKEPVVTKKRLDGKIYTRKFVIGHSYDGKEFKPVLLREVTISSPSGMVLDVKQSRVVPANQKSKPGIDSITSKIKSFLF